jgi:hypothetical protein
VVGGRLTTGCRSRTDHVAVTHARHLCFFPFHSCHSQAVPVRRSLRRRMLRQRRSNRRTVLGGHERWGSNPPDSPPRVFARLAFCVSLPPFASSRFRPITLSRLRFQLAADCAVLGLTGTASALAGRVSTLLSRVWLRSNTPIVRCNAHKFFVGSGLWRLRARWRADRNAGLLIPQSGSRREH